MEPLRECRPNCSSLTPRMTDVEAQLSRPRLPSASRRLSPRASSSVSHEAQRRLSLWKEQSLLLPQHPNLFSAPPTVLVDCAHLIAEAHVQNWSFGQSNWSICLAHLHRLVGLLEYCGKTLTVTPAAHCPILRDRWQLFTPHFIV